MPATQPEDADVVILAPTRLNVSVLADMRHAAERNPTPVVLVVDEIGDADRLTVIECRVVAVLPRAAATGERLLHSVLAAASGGCVLPPDLLGELLKHVAALQREVLAPHGRNPAGLSAHEIDVLRLLADGMDAIEVARHYAIRSARSRTLSPASPPD
ncbi:MAG TPA: DNA-binding response regulator [Pseudonocardiaceae bacterium]